jgi:RecA/RadA recombinase
VIEVYGPESSGKTTLALHIIAEAQKQGGTWKKHCRAVEVAGFVSSLCSFGIRL